MTRNTIDNALKRKREQLLVEKKQRDEQIKRALEHPAFSSTTEPSPEPAPQSMRCAKCGRPGHAITACLFPPVPP